MQEELIKKIKDYYITNGLKIPTKVSEYIDNFPPGLSRQTLKSKYNLTAAEVLELLSPEYTKPLGAQERALKEAKRLNYTIVSNLSLLKNNRDRVELKCMDCSNIHTTTITSLAGSSLGCPKCKAGNLPWHKRRDELEKLVDTLLDAEIVGEIPTNQKGNIKLKHKPCGTEYSTQLVGVTYPNSTLRATCPNCRKSDRRVTYNGKTFGSNFELECYKQLEHLSPDLHVKYSDYFTTDRGWVCDFKIKNYWIEVSNFKQDFKDYFKNISEKETLVSSNGGIFLFVASVKELQELIQLISDDIVRTL